MVELTNLHSAELECLIGPRRIAGYVGWLGHSGFQYEELVRVCVDELAVVVCWVCLAVYVCCQWISVDKLPPDGRVPEKELASKK